MTWCRSIVILLVVLSASQAFAANVYLRAGGTSTSCRDTAGDGSVANWNTATACGSASVAENLLVRGDTLWVADGSYGFVLFNTANSSTTLITVKKAIPSSHGTSTGWLDTYGDGSADFTNWQVNTDYYEFDGQVGQWASDLPGYVPYGFRVFTDTGTTQGYKIIRGGPNLSDLRTNHSFKHVEAYMTNTPKASGNWTLGQDVFNSNTDQLLISYCWFHDAGRVIVYLLPRTVTVEYSVIERSGHADVAEGFAPSEHSEALHFVQTTGTGETLTFRYNVMRDWRSTGGLIQAAQNSTVIAHGNVFATTGYWAIPSEANDGNGALNGNSNPQYTGMTMIAYNNTFANIPYGGKVATMAGGWASALVKNNLFYNVRLCSSNGVDPCANIGMEVGGTHDYNWFYGSGTQSETNIQNGSGDPFVSIATKNYHLAAATSAGDSSIGATYTCDRVGVTGGVLVWGVGGAFYFVSTGGGGGVRLTLTTMPSGCTGGVVCTTVPTVTCQDSGGATVTDCVASVTLSIFSGPTGGAISGTTNPQSLVSGVRQFTGFTLNKVGTYIIRATDAASGLIEAESDLIDVTASAVTNLQFITQPVNAGQGIVMTQQPSVGCYDAGGNLVTTCTDEIALTLNTCTGLAGTDLSIPAVAGIAQYAGIKVTSAGTGCTLTADETPSAGYTAATSTSFTITAVPETSVPGRGIGGAGAR